MKKESDNILVIAGAREAARVGDYLVAGDADRSLVLQIYDERYLDVEGVEEEIAREEVMSYSTSGTTEDPTELTTISTQIRDMRVLVCKARGTISKGVMSPRADWMPSRTNTRVSRLGVRELLGNASLGRRGIRLGMVDSGSEFSVPAEAFDGRITVITGRKESGKSHLSKMILRGLLGHGAYSIVFDLNDEYGGIGLDGEGRRTDTYGRVRVMRPGRELRLSLGAAGLRSVTNLLSHSLDMPGTSLREFVKIWEMLAGRGDVSLASLEAAIHQWRCNEFVRDALFARFHTLASCGLFTDSEERQFDLQGFFSGGDGEGGCLVVSLCGASPLNRRLVVELILSKMVDLLEQRRVPPVFLFAEEAHLYLRDTYWEDLITRMRHFGVFTVFVTNQPDAIDQKIYRQVDNIFLYNFSNDADLSMVSQASMADTDTVKAVVRTLPPRVCLLLGHAVNNLPVIVSVDPFDSPPSGTTRRFFAETEELGAAQRVSPP